MNYYVCRRLHTDRRIRQASKSSWGTCLFKVPKCWEDPESEEPQLCHNYFMCLGEALETLTCFS